MIPEMPALIPLENSHYQLNMQAATAKHPPPQAGSEETESDNHKRVAKQMLFVKRIRALLGRELTKLDMMTKPLQLGSINNIEILEQENIRRLREKETATTNRDREDECRNEETAI